MDTVSKPVVAVKPHNNLKVHMKKCKAVDEVIQIIKGVPKLSQVRNDPELLKWLLEYVEDTLSTKVKSKLKVEDLIFEALCEVFPAMNENEKDVIKKSIEFLVNNKQIKKNGFVRKGFFKVLGYLFKKA